MTPAQREAIVLRAVEEIWNDGDLEVADELFGPEYVNHYGVITELVRGPEAVKICAAMYLLAFPNLQISAQVFAGEDQTVVIHWTAASHSVDRSLTVDEVAGNRRALNGVTRCRIAAGRIAESWTELLERSP